MGTFRPPTAGPRYWSAGLLTGFARSALRGLVSLALADADATHTLTFRELERLLEDYARSDVEPLFELADALGG